MTVEAIKEAITELPDDERMSLALWLNQLDYDDWDNEMVRDFGPGGRREHLVEQIKRDVLDGKSRPMSEGLSSRHKTRH